MRSQTVLAGSLTAVLGLMPGRAPAQSTLHTTIFTGSPEGYSVFMKAYMLDWDKAVASSKNADELRTAMTKRYPNLGMEQLLNNGAQARFQPAPVR
jgi:hypothetical protein